jgi:hypothetical protein
MSEITVSKQELAVLLNQLPSKIIVDYPLSNDQILSIEAVDNHFELEVHLETDLIPSDSELWDKEKPSYSDYRQIFLASNLITYSNLNEFLEDHRVYNNLKQKIVYAPDTNLFYYQFLSTGILKPSEILLVDTAQKELIRVLNKKFTPGQINKLKQSVKYQKHLLDQFTNTRRKSSRLANNLALQEYQQYSDQVYATAKTGELAEDKEDVDTQFVEAVKKYRDNSRTYSIVLTSDKALTDLCKVIGIPFFRLELPNRINPETSTPEQLCHLLCNLAGVLGVIQINNILLFGEYRGKQNVNEYKVRYLRGEIPIEVERDLEICRELMKLKINF